MLQSTLQIMGFDELVLSLTQTGLDWHRDTIIRNSLMNVPHITHTLRSVPEDPRPCLIISGGPSLYREKMLKRIAKHSSPEFTIVAADSAYVQCLRHDVLPDYVVTLDPHPTRMVRWFGDPDLEANLNGDDYFARQDLDVSFRENQAVANEENIKLVDSYRAPLVISSTSPSNVVKRTASHKRYWFAPLVDDPDEEDSITRKICEATDLPAMNTGGTIGTAAWVFANSILKSENIAVVGMDFGYYYDTPIEQTQSWHMLNGDREYYPSYVNPDGQRFFTDPTYWWYRQNFLDLLEANDKTVSNCSGAGLLYGDRVAWRVFEEWLGYKPVMETLTTWRVK